MTTTHNKPPSKGILQSRQQDIAAWAILTLGALITLWTWHSVKNTTLNDALTRFDFRAEQIRASVAERMVAYEQILLGGAGLFAASPIPVTRDMWRTYVENLHIEENYPGIQGVGFSLQIRPEDKEEHVREIRAEGFPEYGIRPGGEREVYTAIIYLEPFSGRNLRAFGFDMFSEAVRRKAMARARDSGKAAISGKVILVQETEMNIQNGFLMYVPIYQNGMPARNPGERQSALLGYAYSPFRINDFLRGIFHAQNANIDFEIYDGDGMNEKTLIYDSDLHRSSKLKGLAEDETALFQTTKAIVFQDQKWTLYFRSLPAFEAAIDRQKPDIVLALGAVFSLMCFVAIHGAFTTRQKALRLADEMTSALSLSENRLKSILDNSPAVIYMKDLEGRYILINKQWASLFRTSNEAMRGKRDSEFFPKNIATAFMANDRQVIQSGEPLIAEEAAPHDDGLHTYISVKFPLRDGAGHIYGMAGISTDITERKLMEAGLKRADERWRLALEGTNDGLWDWNIKTGDIYYSPSLMAMIGYEPFELEGHVRSWGKLIHPDDAPHVMETMNLYLAGKIPGYETEHRLRTKSGEWKWVLDRGKVFDRSPEGRPLRAVGTIADITQRKRNEEDLQKLSHAIKQSLSSVMITNLQGDIEYVNPKFEEVTGYHSVEVIGRKASFLKSGVHPPGFYHKLWETILSGKEFRHEFCNRKKNGELFWELQSISPIYDSKGDIRNFISISIDDMERRKAVEALKKSEMELREARERLDLAIRGSYDGLWDWSTREEDPVWCSPMLYQLMEYEDGEFVMTPQKFAELLHEEDRGRVIKAINAHLGRKNDAPYNVEFRLRTKSGCYRWYIARGQALWGTHGKPIRFAGSLRDITERKQADEELQEHREHLSELVKTRTLQLSLENQERQQAEERLARTLREQDTIFSTNPDIIYVADLHSCLVKWNKRLETVTGYSSREIMGKTFFSFFPPNEAGMLAGILVKVMTEGKAEVESHLLCQSGALIPYHFNGVPLRNEQGDIIGFTGTGRDITERKQADERLRKIYEQLIHSEKLSALGKLTGSIAHEFNNPIYGLRSIIEQTREEEGLHSEIKELLDLAVRECDRMAGLVRKLQGFYKPSDDTKNLVDIHQLLDDIEALSKKKLKVKGIELTKEYSPVLPEAHMVEDQIKQVLLNLINNAEESIHGECGKITVSTEFDENHVKVHIKDNGEGIPQENLKLIFEPFFSTKGMKGTGLGLSVCYGIVNAHGGSIEVTSKPGAGSIFTLTLPVQGDME